MESSLSTDAIVALEDDAPEVLFEVSQVANVHLWPLLRMPLARASADSELGTMTLERRQTRLQYAQTLASELILPHKHSSRRVPRGTHNLFIVNGTTVNSTSQGKEDWLVGDLAANTALESVILQDRGLPRSPAQGTSPVFARTFADRDLALRVGLAARRVAITADAIAQIKRFIKEVISQFDFPVDPATVTRLEVGLIAATRRLGPYQRIYGRFLDRVNPRTVILANASYTNRPALLPLLREREIAVYEPQHGWIGPAHAAYNFGAAFSDPPLRAYLPDALLTFGDFWSESIRHPSDKIAIGKAALEKAVHRTKSETRVADRVLLVSSVFKAAELVQLARALRDRLPSDLTVVLRPHPSERLLASTKFAGALSLAGVELDDEPDLYHSLARSKAVVGYASTVLFEALPFHIPTLVIDSSLSQLYTPREVFGEPLSVDAAGVNRILEAIHGSPEKAMTVDVTKIWRPGATRNFNAFLDSVGGAPGSNA